MVLLLHTISTPGHILCSSNYRRIPLFFFFFCTLKAMTAGEKNQALEPRSSRTNGYSKPMKLKGTSSSFSVNDQRSHSGESGSYKSVSGGKGYMDQKNPPSSVCTGGFGRKLHTGKNSDKALEEVADIHQIKSSSSQSAAPFKLKPPSSVCTGGFGRELHTGKNSDKALEEVADIHQIKSSSSQSAAPFKLKPSLFDKNRETRELQKQSKDGFVFEELRLGMVLLKSYLSLTDQVEILRTCEELGSGPGGFYQPSYRDGGKLRLKMMCLGKNWDPESRYEAKPFLDATEPPSINEKFKDLVRSAIQDSHARLQTGGNSVEKILPSMIPDLCIINFYTNSGRLGLHQDKDESQESLKKGLPVVSFSIGDSADFLYGTERDEDKAEKIKLESGDVLIFGGESRHIFHGVSFVHPNTAPKRLLGMYRGCLSLGRLNLTFRKY